MLNRVSWLSCGCVFWCFIECLPEIKWCMEEVKEQDFPQLWNQTPRCGYTLNLYVKRQENHPIFSTLLQCRELCCWDRKTVDKICLLKWVHMYLCGISFVMSLDPLITKSYYKTVNIARLFHKMWITQGWEFCLKDMKQKVVKVNYIHWFCYVVANNVCCV
jgi:hypothetical protein